MAKKKGRLLEFPKLLWRKLKPPKPSKPKPTPLEVDINMERIIKKHLDLNQHAC